MGQALLPVKNPEDVKPPGSLTRGHVDRCKDVKVFSDDDDDDI